MATAMALGLCGQLALAEGTQPHRQEAEQFFSQLVRDSKNPLITSFARQNLDQLKDNTARRRYEVPLLTHNTNSLAVPVMANGKIMGTKCPECKRVLVPPRIFCEECFVDTDEWVEVSTSGEILTFAESYFGLQGQRLEQPWYIGIVKLDGADGGLFHRIVKGDSEIAIGGRVEAVLADERKGHIMDIVNFKTV